MKKIITTLILTMFAFTATAQMSITAQNTPVTIDFSGFTGSGFTPNPSAGQLDSDTFSLDGFGTNVAFGGTATSGDMARGATTGGVSTGGVYALSTLRALWIQPGGSDFTPGNIYLRVVNNTGNPIDSLDVSYDILSLNDANRSNSLNFSYSTDGTNYTSVPALDFSTAQALDAAATVQTANRTTTISGLAANFQNGDTLTLRFSGDDVSGSGSRDEYGLDNITVEATSVPVELMNFDVE